MKNMSILTEILAKSPRLIKSGAVNQKQIFPPFVSELKNII